MTQNHPLKRHPATGWKVWARDSGSRRKRRLGDNRLAPDNRLPQFDGAVDFGQKTGIGGVVAVKISGRETDRSEALSDSGVALFYAPSA